MFNGITDGRVVCDEDKDRGWEEDGEGEVVDAARDSVDGVAGEGVHGVVGWEWVGGVAEEVRRRREGLDRRRSLFRR